MLREWCINNPHNPLEYKTSQSVSSWNKGIPTSDETKKQISNAKKGISVNKGMKRPYAKENLKKITHRAYGQFQITEPSGRKIIITDLTIISARKNKLIKEKSVLAPKPTACDVISASIFVLHT